MNSSNIYYRLYLQLNNHREDASMPPPFDEERDIISRLSSFGLNLQLSDLEASVAPSPVEYNDESFIRLEKSKAEILYSLYRAVSGHGEHVKKFTGNGGPTRISTGPIRQKTDFYLLLQSLEYPAESIRIPVQEDEFLSVDVYPNSDIVIDWPDSISNEETSVIQQENITDFGTPIHLTLKDAQPNMKYWLVDADDHNKSYSPEVLSTGGDTTVESHVFVQDAQLQVLAAPISIASGGLDMTRPLNWLGSLRVRPNPDKQLSTQRVVVFTDPADGTNAGDIQIVNPEPEVIYVLIEDTDTDPTLVDLDDPNISLFQFQDNGSGRIIVSLDDLERNLDDDQRFKVLAYKEDDLSSLKATGVFLTRVGDPEILDVEVIAKEHFTLAVPSDVLVYGTAAEISLSIPDTSLYQYIDETRELEFFLLLPGLPEVRFTRISDTDFTVQSESLVTDAPVSVKVKVDAYEETFPTSHVLYVLPNTLLVVQPETVLMIEGTDVSWEISDPQDDIEYLLIDLNAAETILATDDADALYREAQTQGAIIPFEGSPARATTSPTDDTRFRVIAQSSAGRRVLLHKSPTEIWDLTANVIGTGDILLLDNRLVVDYAGTATIRLQLPDVDTFGGDISQLAVIVDGLPVSTVSDNGSPIRTYTIQLLDQRTATSPVIGIQIGRFSLTLGQVDILVRPNPAVGVSPTTTIIGFNDTLTLTIDAEAGVSYTLWDATRSLELAVFTSSGDQAILSFLPSLHSLDLVDIFQIRAAYDTEVFTFLDSTVEVFSVYPQDWIQPLPTPFATVEYQENVQVRVALPDTTTLHGVSIDALHYTIAVDGIERPMQLNAARTHAEITLVDLTFFTQIRVLLRVDGVSDVGESNEATIEVYPDANRAVMGLEPFYAPFDPLTLTIPSPQPNVRYTLIESSFSGLFPIEEFTILATGEAQLVLDPIEDYIDTSDLTVPLSCLIEASYDHRLVRQLRGILDIPLLDLAHFVPTMGDLLLAFDARPRVAFVAPDPTPFEQHELIYQVHSHPQGSLIELPMQLIRRQYIRDTGLVNADHRYTISFNVASRAGTPYHSDPFGVYYISDRRVEDLRALSIEVTSDEAFIARGHKTILSFADPGIGGEYDFVLSNSSLANPVFAINPATNRYEIETERLAQDHTFSLLVRRKALVGIFPDTQILIDLQKAIEVRVGTLRVDRIGLSRMRIPAPALPGGKQMTIAFWHRAIGWSPVSTPANLHVQFIQRAGSRNLQQIELILPFAQVLNTQFRMLASHTFTATGSPPIQHIGRVYDQEPFASYANQWTHIAVTFQLGATDTNGKTNEIRLFRNGRNVPVNSIGLLINRSDENFGFTENTISINRYQGELADFSIWSTVLADARIPELMNTRLNGGEHLLRAYWPMIETDPANPNIVPEFADPTKNISFV